MAKVEDEISLPLRVHPQPQPYMADGGDCAACCIAGVCGVRPEDVYKNFMGGEISSPGRLDMEPILRSAQSRGLVSRYNIDVPRWGVPDYYMAFGESGYINSNEWFRYLWMAFEAGYYGLASVVFDKTGANGMLPPETDHMVLLCGAREVSIPHPTMSGASRTQFEVLVSCSAKSSPKVEWVEAREFLTQRGGFTVILVKP